MASSRDEVMTIEILARRALEHPDRVFAVFPDGEEWTYARTADEAWRTANALRARGISEGDHVSVWFPGGKDGVRVFFGVLAAGAVFAPLNLAYRGRLLEHALNVTASWFLVAHTELLPRLEGLDVPNLRTIVSVGPGRDKPMTVNGIDVIGDDDLRSDNTRQPELEHPRGPWDHMCLMFTSGTTGPSKGVHQSYTFYDEFCEGIVRITAEDRISMAPAPIFHNGWPLYLQGALRKGGSVFVTDRFRPSTFWDEARKHGVTVAYLVGTMAHALLKNPPSADDRNHPMRRINMAPNTPDNKEFERRFGLLPTSGYGSTEVGYPIRTTDPGVRDPTTCGKVRAGYAARIVDAFDQEVPVGEVGELIVRSDRPWALCSGYKDMAEATVELYRNGWLHTGDAFRRDEDGYYYFVDRMKDVIRRRGENISSVEVESEVLTHPAVAKVAAYGVPDPHSQEEVMVAVEPKPGALVEPRQLAEFLIERLPHYMVPRYIVIHEKLPLTATERVRKPELRDEGVTANTWDREAEGIVLSGQRLTPE
ncbi:MAG TPA: AMP-binding protein [Amycolatopsis sp.]|nr:AMP-binding protein [Amycolatopsis sp.]